MKLHSLALPLVAAVTLGSALPAAAQTEPFRWAGDIARGKTIEVRGVNGTVRAVPSDDRTTRVEAVRRARRSDPASVRIEVVEHAGGVTLCAVYPTPAGARHENDCRPGGGQSSVRNNDTRVDFVVHVPAGVAFSGSTVNGDVTVERLGSTVAASTVNGAVRIETTEFARASTVNGSITSRMGHARPQADVSYSTVNGSIVLEVPAALDARLRASTVNGRIDSDLPVTVSGRMGPRTLHGTVGRGGAELSVSTVNGSIRLRRI